MAETTLWHFRYSGVERIVDKVRPVLWRLATGIKKESYLTLNGTHITLTQPIPNGAEVFTIEAKLSTTQTNGMFLCYRSQGSSKFNAGDFWFEISNGIPQFAYALSSNVYLRVSDFDYRTQINDGKPHTVAFVAYEDSEILYIDGKNVYVQDGGEFALPDKDFTLTPLWKSVTLQMNLYELRIWSTARTSDEIFSDIHGDEEGLVAWYLPEPSGLCDHSVNQHTTRTEGDTPTYTVSFPPEKFDLEWEFIAPFPVSATFDVSREVVSYWRYYNPGSEIYLLTHGVQLDNLPVDKSKTGVAFYQTAQEKCFDIPATHDFWVKFDVYCTDSSQTWRAFSVDDDGTIFYGVRSYSDGALGVFLYKKTTQLIVADAIKVGTLQTILMHMTTSTVEVWVDGGSRYSYSNKKRLGNSMV